MKVFFFKFQGKASRTLSSVDVYCFGGGAVSAAWNTGKCGIIIPLEERAAKLCPCHRAAACVHGTAVLRCSSRVDERRKEWSLLPDRNEDAYCGGDGGEEPVWSPRV